MFLNENFDTDYKPLRIISLVPSITELLSYFELEQEVAGITKFCVHPENWYRTKTRIGGTKNLDFKTINNLKPDLIIASKEENVKGQVHILSAKYPVCLTDVQNFDDALHMIAKLGSLVDRLQVSESLVQLITDALGELNNKLAGSVKSKVAYLIWKNPYMVAGGDTYISSMLQQAGFSNVFQQQNRYPQKSLQEIADAGADLIFLSTEPYPFTVADVEMLQQHLPDAFVVLVDGEMFSWYGSRMLKAANYFTQLRATLP